MAISARLCQGPRPRIIVKGFSPSRTLADFQNTFGIREGVVHITWLQEQSIGIEADSAARAEEFVHKINGTS